MPPSGIIPLPSDSWDGATWSGSSVSGRAVSEASPRLAAHKRNTIRRDSLRTMSAAVLYNRPSVKRTIYCGDLRKGHVGQTVTLCGWIHSRRDHGGVVFCDVRDRTGLVQAVFHPEKT